MSVPDSRNDLNTVGSSSNDRFFNSVLDLGWICVFRVDWFKFAAKQPGSTGLAEYGATFSGMLEALLTATSSSGAGVNVHSVRGAQTESSRPMQVNDNYTTACSDGCRFQAF